MVLLILEKITHEFKKPKHESQTARAENYKYLAASDDSLQFNHNLHILVTVTNILYKNMD